LKREKKTIIDSWWNLNSSLKKKKRTKVGSNSLNLKERERKIRVGSSRSSNRSLKIKNERPVQATRGAREKEKDQSKKSSRREIQGPR
jgi:hypothetical protein